MTSQIQERDWKYLRSIHDELLNELCSRILAMAVVIAAEEEASPYQRYQTLYRHIKESDEIIVGCFDDWRRSTISARIVSLRRHQLLTEKHLEHMSYKAQGWLRMVGGIVKY